ncbi:MAG: bifunctional oligoribonuclease/PAP phosphatase NrnA [Bacilli bacterium]|nr:bifunctional oligoribonuclease/PAP phosphatase NrnA [Bacilli bacterium]
MYKLIYKEIKKFDTIVIARHIGVDPDAMASQIALRDAIKLSFPEKRVLAVGTGSAKFKYIGNLDKLENIQNALLIVTDTPDKKRIDISSFDGFCSIIKIDHHPFIERFCDIECIQDTASSACEIIMDLIKNTKLVCDENISRTLFMGLVADSNRFLFDSCSPKTFELVAYYLENYPFKLSETYKTMYKRPLKEVRLEGYISTHMEVTEHGVGYIKITDDIINQYKVDSASAGNMVNNFNFIEEVLVWATITEDIKNEIIRVSIRSRGPRINDVAEQFHGGGHALASGAKVESFEIAMELMNALDKRVKEYLEESFKLKKEDEDGN